MRVVLTTSKPKASEQELKLIRAVQGAHVLGVNGHRVLLDVVKPTTPSILLKQLGAGWQLAGSGQATLPVDDLTVGRLEG